MGTPEFAVESLNSLLADNFNIVAVVTAPDKPSGRGLQIKASAVKEFAVKQNLPVLQPVKLNDPQFIEELSSLKPDLFVVVAFRMLPASVWTIPLKGTINLHASLLPQYRGAAPINHAIINGETKSGVTTFFINDQIDTGKIIDREQVEILPHENAGDLHDKLMLVGANLLCRTVSSIINDSAQPHTQDKLITDIHSLKLAPKIFKEFCYINWNNNTKQVYDFIRGLSPYPGSIAELISPENKSFFFKIFFAEMEITSHAFPPGTIVTDKKKFLSIATADGLVNIQELQLSGKVRMQISEFLRGFSIDMNWKAKVI